MRLHGCTRFALLALTPCFGFTRLAGLDGKARRERIEGGIGLDLGRVEGAFFAPDQPRLLTLLDNRLERSAERPPDRSERACGSGGNDPATTRPSDHPETTEH
jgi:hypothetical protein